MYIINTIISINTIHEIDVEGGPFHGMTSSRYRDVRPLQHPVGASCMDATPDVVDPSKRTVCAGYTARPPRSTVRQVEI